MSYKSLYSAAAENGQDITLHVDGQSDGDNGDSAVGQSSTSSPQRAAGSLFAQENRDLLPGGSPKSQIDAAKRRKIAVVLFILLLLAITTAVVLLVCLYNRGHTVTPHNPVKAGPSLSFDSIFNPDFAVSPPSVMWMARSSKLVDYSVARGIVARSPDGASQTVLARFPSSNNYSVLRELLELESISPDERYALMTLGGKTSIFRHSTSAIYVLVKLSTSAHNVHLNMVSVNNGDPLRIVRWTGSGAHLVYVPVSHPDVYYLRDVEDGTSAVRLTHNGVLQLVLNGVADWLYEEEILHMDAAMWPSPDSRHVAYITFNESAVEFFNWVEYGDPAEDYVKVQKLRYPKAGHTNPTVTLTVQSLDGSTASSSVTLRPPTALLSTSQFYITYVQWLNSTHISVQWMPRLQTVAYLTAYHIPSSIQVNSSLAAVSTLKWIAPVGWVEIYPYLPAFNGQAVLMRLPRLESPHFVHLALVEITSGSMNMVPRFLTNGEWEVSSIDSVSPGSDYSLVQATAAGAEYRHLYTIPLSSRAARIEITHPVCLSCNAGSSCLYNTFKVSHAADYLLWTCQGPGLPRVQVASVGSSGKGDAHVLSYVENYTAFAYAAGSVGIPRVDFMRLPVDGRQLPAMRISGTASKASTKKVPTLMYGYNGPLSQLVIAQHPLMFNGELGRWLLYLVSEHGFQVFIVDGRGTPYLGDSYGKAQYWKIGEVESSDQLGAARHIIAHYNADPARMAFWGWSYGGFLAAYIATRADNLFQVCMAVAPVTDWNYYDTAYTERMEGLPKDNTNYETSSIIHRAQHFGNTKFLVVHGSGDDNVHFQNTAQLAEALIKNNVQFRMQVYTDKTHSLLGKNTERHFYTLLSDFLLTSFGMKTFI